MQIELELDPESISPKLTLSSFSFGKPFRLDKSTKSELLIKVKPVNFLCNSSILSDVFARGDCVVCNLQKGTVFITKGSREVFPVDATIKVKK